MANDLVAKASATVDASASQVWKALVDPDEIRKYMFGTNVESNWTKGSPITWKGEWQGKAYEDKGTIVRIEPERVLEYTHFSPLAGKPDLPENYHTVTIELDGNGSRTGVTLSQDGNETTKEQEHSAKNWSMMLEGLKKLVEG